MFKKFTTKKLLIVFFSLLLLVVISKFFKNKSGERTFKEAVVSIDSVNALRIKTILLYPSSENHAEIKFEKENNVWFVMRGGIKAKADTGIIKQFLSNIVSLKVQQLATNEKNMWKEFGVDDSSATRVKLLDEASETMADVFIGRFAFNQHTRSGSTYVRASSENEVYSVEGFLSMSVNQKFDQWRNKVLVVGKPEEWNKISIQHPADSGFVLVRKEKQWYIDSIRCDSAKVAQYISTLSNLYSSSFMDTYNSSNQSPQHTLKIEGEGLLTPITINVFNADAANTYAIQSSLNTESYFSGMRDGLYNRIFIPKEKLLFNVSEENKN